MDAAGHTRSIWMDTVDMPTFPPLTAHATADVCVIGAGIAGMTTALLMLHAGRSVIVIDAKGVGAGETGRTTAHLFNPDERYFQIEKRFGHERASLVAQTHRRATDLVEEIIRAEGIDCDFARLDGYLVLPRGGDPSELEREYESAQRLSVDVGRLSQVPGMPFDTGPCLRFDHQGRFHPLKYLAGLAGSIERMGGTLHGNTRALRITKAEGGHLVETEGGAVQAGAVVVATNTPFHDRVVMHTKQSGYMTYVVAARVPRGVVPDVLLWDTGDPYYYLRLWSPPDESGNDILIVGGQDHKTGQDNAAQHRFAAIEAWIQARIPLAAEVTHRWSGEVMEPADGLAFLGRSPMDGDGVYMITGDSGNGMTHCTAGAMIIRDLICGAENPWTAVYEPSRKMFHGVGEYLAEQANTVAQYGDWLKPGELASAAQVGLGEGGIVRKGLELFAVHRTMDGEVLALSAKCTHLGCAVHWNSVEKTWDCPCHASRFDTTGAVLHGPANTPLAKASLDEE